MDNVRYTPPPPTAALLLEIVNEIRLGPVWVGFLI